LEKRTRKGRSKKFYVCDKKGTDPDCPFISWDLPVEGKKCSECGGYIVAKRFRGRSYERCGDPKCPSNMKKPKANNKGKPEKS
jgi:DNA topoisomerase-1